MSKKLSDLEKKRLAESEALLAQTESLRRDSIAAFNEPRVSLGEITGKLNISEMTVRNWLTRHQLRLSANEGRADGKWRKFSIRDVVVIAVAYRLSRLGVPPSAFAKMSDDFAKLSERLSSTIMNSAAPSPKMVISNDEKWHFAVLAENEIPSAAIILDVERVLQETLEPLGLNFVRGTKEDHRRWAEELDAEGLKTS